MDEKERIYKAYSDTILNEGNELKKLEDKSIKLANKVKKDIDKLESFIAQYDTPGVKVAILGLVNARDTISEAIFQLSKGLKSIGYETPVDKPAKTKAPKGTSIFSRGLGFK